MILCVFKGILPTIVCTTAPPSVLVTIEIHLYVGLKLYVTFNVQQKNILAEHIFYSELLCYYSLLLRLLMRMRSFARVSLVHS